MNNTVFKDDTIVLLMTDHSNNMEIISEKLEKMQVFEQVCFIKSKGKWENRSLFQKGADGLSIITGITNRYAIYLNGIKNLKFDEIICFNYAIDIYGLYSLIYEHNKSVRVSLYEEGILSYRINQLQTHRRQIIDCMRKCLGKASLSESLGYFYCMYPEIYTGELKTIKIPRITKDTDTACTLIQLFDLHDVDTIYKEKYIFFTSVYDFEGGEPIGEYELVENVANRVGKDNLLIKMHPRDKRDVYVKNNYKVDINSSIPWEAIQLSGEFKDKVYMTATSGSVLASSLMSDTPVWTYYMYKLCNIMNNASAIKSASTIEYLLTDSEIHDMFGKTKIIADLNEIK